jgi:hypothetical protein
VGERQKKFRSEIFSERGRKSEVKIDRLPLSRILLLNEVKLSLFHKG